MVEASPRSSIKYCNLMVYINSHCSNFRPIRRKLQTSNTFSKRGFNIQYGLHRFSIPNKYIGFRAYFSCNDSFSIRMDVKRCDVINMSTEKFLGIVFRVQNYSDCRCMIDNFSIRQISNIISSIFTSVTPNVFFMEGIVRLFTMVFEFFRVEV